jgi:hypothetical protein
VTSLTDRLMTYLKAGYSGVCIETHEEKRAVGDILEAAKRANKGFATWSSTEGIKTVLPTVEQVPDTDEVFFALRARLKDTVLVMRDLQTWPLADPGLNRLLRDLLQWAPSEGSTIVFVGHKAPMHPTIEKLVVVLDYGLPTEGDLTKVAEGIAKSTGKKVAAGENVLRALSGLSMSEAENALALSYVEKKEFDPEVIYREKVLAVKRSGLLEIVAPDPRGLDAIGGLEEMKDWILRRRRAFSKEAIAFRLPPPKGIMIVGVPGTGKSLASKAIGTALDVPTVRLDVGSLFNSLIGESESRTREVLKLAEAVAPCVLWTDEIDKGLAGASGSGSNDSGVTKRVFGTIISWMQERSPDRPVFLVATANDVTSLPPEFLRRGRWDEIFAVDLPHELERAAIFEIQIKRFGRDPKKYDLGAAVNATEGFTGAEIEAVVTEALYSAFDRGEEPTSDDIVAASRVVVPLIRTAKEQVERIRSWSDGRARMASRKPVQNVIEQRVRKLA